MLELPSLAEPAGAHIRGQVIVGFLVCGAAAYRSFRFIVMSFETLTTLTRLAMYRLVVGAASVIRFA